MGNVEWKTTGFCPGSCAVGVEGMHINFAAVINLGGGGTEYPGRLN